MWNLPKTFLLLVVRTWRYFRSLFSEWWFFLSNASDKIQYSILESSCVLKNTISFSYSPKNIRCGPQFIHHTVSQSVEIVTLCLHILSILRLPRKRQTYARCYYSPSPLSIVSVLSLSPSLSQSLHSISMCDVWYCGPSATKCDAKPYIASFSPLRILKGSIFSNIHLAINLCLLFTLSIFDFDSFDSSNGNKSENENSTEQKSK